MGLFGAIATGVGNLIGSGKVKNFIGSAVGLVGGVLGIGNNKNNNNNESSQGTRIVVDPNQQKAIEYSGSIEFGNSEKKEESSNTMEKVKNWFKKYWYFPVSGIGLLVIWLAFRPRRNRRRFRF